MARSCARPACSDPATATLTFDGLRRIVWISPLAEAAAYSAGDLCRRHTERFRPPIHWELRDVRPVATAPAVPAGTAAPSRYAAPRAPIATAPAPLPFEPVVVADPEPTVEQPAAQSATPEAAPETPVERPAAVDAPRPLLPRPAAAPVPRPTSPLLSRAFRNVG